MRNLICPISKERIPEHLPRVIAFINISLMVTYLLIESSWILAFLLVGFILRGYDYTKFSLVYHLAKIASKKLKLKSKQIDKVPKLFASRLGGFMMLLALAFSLIGLEVVSYSIIGMVIALSTLECVLSLCVGCLIYTYLILPFSLKTKKLPYSES